MKNFSILAVAAITVMSISMFVTACKHTSTASIVTPNPDPVIPKDTVALVGWKCSPDSVYFNFDVLPVLIASCGQSGCHNASSAAEGYNLTDYTNTIKRGIVAGQATSSKVYAVIYNGSMPPRGSGVVMTQGQKDIIAKWINQGAKNLTCNPSYGVCDSTNVKFSTVILPIVQNQCQGCHGATNPNGGLSLTNYAQVNASVKTGKFWGCVAQLSGFSPMPVGTKLQTCDLNKIDAWIKRGALNN